MKEKNWQIYVMPVGLKEKPNIVQKAEDSLENFRILEMRKKVLLERLSGSADITAEERNQLIGRIFEHSTEDGLDAADALILGREERIAALTRDDFIQKHHEFSLKLSNKLREYQPDADQEDKECLADFADTIAEKVARRKAGETVPFARPKVFSKSAEKLLEEIDNYYAGFLRLQKAGQKENFDLRSQGEKIAEETLEMDLNVLEPHYYVDHIRNSLGVRVDPRLAVDILIDQVTLDKILAEAKVSLEDEEVQKKVKEARYRPLREVYYARQEMAQRTIRKEILESLTGRGYKETDFELVFDEKSQKFQVLDKNKKEQKIKKENLRLVAEVPRTFVMKKEDPYYEKMKRIVNGKYEKKEYIDEKTGELKLRSLRTEILDGEIYQEVGVYNGRSFIIYPDGRKSDIFYSIQGEWKVAKKGLTFMINDAKRRGGRNNFQLTVDGKRINEDDAWDFGIDYVEAGDGSIFCLAEKRGENWAGNWAIFKDDQMLISYPYGNNHIRNLTLIDGKPAYIMDGDGSSSLIFGGEKLGPFKSIVMPKDNSTLTFAAEKKDGKRMICIDGVEHSFSAEGEIVDIVQAGQNAYVMMARVIEKENRDKGLYHDKKTYCIVDQKGNKITNESEKLNREYSHRGNFWSIKDKLVYTIEEENADGKSRRILHWGDEKKDVTNCGDVIPAGVINGELFYFSKSGVYSFRFGRINFGKDSVNVESAKVVDGKIIIVVEDENRSRTVFEYSPTLLLTDDERRKVEILSALNSTSSGAIKDYFQKYYPQEAAKSLLEKLRDKILGSDGFFADLDRAVKESPEVFLETMKAKQDDLSELNIDQFIASIFPELATNSERAKREADRRNRRWGSGMNASSYLSGNRETQEFRDGDPEEKEKLELLHLREPLGEFLSTGVYGKYKSTYKSWEQIGFPISGQFFGPTKEITAEIPVSDGMKDIILPKILNALIIPERVKCVMENGEEVALEVAVNTLGEARVTVPKGAKKILYSQTAQELPVVPEDIDAVAYAKFKDDYEKRFGKEISEKIAALPEELRMFIESLQGKNPAEKIEEIEEFVRSIGFYDFKNKEVKGLKESKSLEEIVAVMARRMKELRRKNPEEAEKMAHKKYAGICADFAKLTAALLREAGIVSGMAAGLQPGAKETILTTANAHAVAFALWPAEEGKAKIIVLDGTPRGMNESEETMLSAMRQMSLKERRKMFESEKEKVTQDVEKTLAELEELVKHLDETAIKKLKNGELERVLNIVLGEVRNSHLSVVDRVLNASRYAGFDVSVITKKDNLETEIRLRQFLESEIEKERESAKENAYFKGADLLHLIDEFVARYGKDKGVRGKEEALDIIEKVLDISKQNLNPIELRSATAVVTYLRAQKMGNG